MEEMKTITEDGIVMQYLDLLESNDKKEELNETRELLDYISSLEKQFNQVVNELHDVREVLDSMQNPTMKERLNHVVDKLQVSVNEGIKSLNSIKTQLIFSMKECISSVKQKGKNTLVKTVNILHIKDGLKKLQKSFYAGMKKTMELDHTSQQISSELSNAKRNIKNVVRLLRGKKPLETGNDSKKITVVQKSSRAMFKRFRTMAISNSKLIRKLDELDKSSVKKDLKLLNHKSKSNPNMIINKKAPER